MMVSHAHTPWQRWWPLGLLCVVASARWLFSEVAPLAGPGPLSEAIGCASAALVMVTIATLRRTPAMRVSSFAVGAAAGALMICGPFVGWLLGVRMIDGGDITVALAVVPVVVAVARPAFRQTDGANLAGRLWPGLAAVAGLLLIVPEPQFSGPRQDALLLLAPLLTGVGAAWFRSRRGVDVWRAPAALAGAAVLFLVAAVIDGGFAVGDPRWLLTAAALDGLLAGLSVLAVLRLGATRWSAQFEIIPLIVLLGGMVSEGPRLDARSVAALVLVVVASVFLLLPPRPVEQVDTVPRV